jgi:hypothetical protein
MEYSDSGNDYSDRWLLDREVAVVKRHAMSFSMGGLDVRATFPPDANNVHHLRVFDKQIGESSHVMPVPVSGESCRKIARISYELPPIEGAWLAR